MATIRTNIVNRRDVVKAAVCAVILSSTLMLAGCPNPNGTVTIRYEQLGACNGYKEGNNIVSAGPTAAYVLFKINSLDNTNGKVNFAYDPARLFVDSLNAKPSVSLTSALTQKIGVLATTAINVPAGQNLGHDGYAVVIVPTANSPDPQIEANQTNYKLAYDTPSGSPGVLFDKKDPSKTQYQGAQDCLSKSW